MDTSKIHNVSPHYFFYHSHQGPKPTYSAYYQRIKVRWMTPEEAIKPMNKSWHIIDEKGRECTRCKEYKEWDQFAKDKSSSTWHTPLCASCSSDRHRAYRSTWTGKIKTRNYKIMYARDPEKRRLTNETHRKYVASRREELLARKKEWYYQNKEKLRKQKQAREKRQFSMWEYVMYEWQKCKLLSDFIRGKWCLVKVWDMRVYLPKKYLKPVKSKSYLEV